MKVANICVDDWANFQYHLTQSMRAVGLDAYGYKLNAHHAKYRDQCDVAGIATIKQLIRDADVVNIVHSNERLFSAVFPVIQNKTINVFYTGTVYRRNPEYFNNIFNRYVNKSVIALGEFAGKGAKNETYMCGAIDVGAEPMIFSMRPWVFGHYPSKPEVKGTEQILDMFNAVHDKRLSGIAWSTDFVDEKYQVERMQRADIYIELFKPVLEGHVYGSFGMTALEAAAMGKAVVTMNLHRELYEKTYGHCMLQICNTPHEFVRTITMLEYMTADELDELRRQTREWVVNKHSYLATGKFLLDNVL